MKVTRKTPQFVHLRRKLQIQLLPKIQRINAYQDDETHEIVHVPADIKFQPKTTQKKIYETASVKVKYIYATHNNA